MTDEARVRYQFFVDDRVYETEHPTLNSMELKHAAGVPSDYRLGHELVRRYLEGNQPLFLSDDESIDLTGEPKRFYSVPQARG